jgi:uncharacterized glyoxalase superfamily protein PhnB
MARILSPMDQQVVPMIHVPDVDVARTIDWYVSIGFTVLSTVEDDDGVNWALLAYGNSRIMVTGGGRSTTDDRRDVDLYIHTDDVDGLFRQLKDRVEIRLDLQDTFYGAREFIVRDPNRYWVTFGQDLGDRAN